MRKVLLASLTICGALMLSCSPEKMPEGTKVDPIPTPTPVDGDAISTSATSLSFTAEGGTENVTITSNFSWETISTPSWITVSPNSGFNGTTSVTITAESSTSTSVRTGTITLGNSSKSVSISVSQSAASVSNEISASVSSLSFIADGESKSISVTSNFAWETISKPSWITLSPSSGSSGTTSVTVTAAKSNDTSERSGTVKFGKSSDVVSIAVTQAAASTEWGIIKMFSINDVSFNMIYVEGGTFRMGSDLKKDQIYIWSPAHNVTLSDYYIGETEVTVELYREVMGTTPVWYDNKKPAVMTWIECYSFIDNLNKKLASQLPYGSKFRFPTEAEWEFAARGGVRSKGYEYSGSNYIDEVAWYENNSTNSDGSNKGASDVKTKKANELGLYDMTGNLEEWCEDVEYLYTEESQYNPTHSSSDLSKWRRARGGSWSCSEEHCRIVWRGGGEPTSTTIIRGSDFGLRLAITH